MALPFSNTAGRTLERLRNAFIETARGARSWTASTLARDRPQPRRLSSPACRIWRGVKPSVARGNNASTRP